MAEANTTFLRQPAARLRRLARDIDDKRGEHALTELAEECDARPQPRNRLTLTAIRDGPGSLPGQHKAA